MSRSDIVRHLCELVDWHQQENGMWARFYQRHRPLRLFPDALLHLASSPVPPRSLHERDAPVIGHPLSQLTAPGAADGDGGHLTQDGVCQRRLPASDVSQQNEPEVRLEGAVRTLCHVSAHSWRANTCINAQINILSP